MCSARKEELSAEILLENPGFYDFVCVGFFVLFCFLTAVSLRTCDRLKGSVNQHCTDSVYVPKVFGP